MGDRLRIFAAKYRPTIEVLILVGLLLGGAIGLGWKLLDPPARAATAVRQLAVEATAGKNAEQDRRIDKLEGELNTKADCILLKLDGKACPGR